MARTWRSDDCVWPTGAGRRRTRDTRRHAGRSVRCEDGSSGSTIAQQRGPSCRPVATDGRRGLTSSSLVIVRDDFFIAEPQAIVSVRAARWLHVDAGVGYRLIAGAENLDDRLGGVGGTISVKFGR